MSSCPEKKLLSAYADNEILSPWLEQIELHIQTCDSCAQTVKKYKALQSLLKQDTVRADSPDYLEKSFERFNSHRKFSRVVSTPERKVSKIVFERFIPIMAAAAIFAFVLPMSLTSESTTATEASVPTVAHLIAPRLPNNAGVISDGTLPHAEFASMISNESVPNIEFSIQLDSLNELSAEEPETLVDCAKDTFYIQVMVEEDTMEMFADPVQFSYIPSLQY